MKQLFAFLAVAALSFSLPSPGQEVRQQLIQLKFIRTTTAGHVYRPLQKGTILRSVTLEKAIAPKPPPAFISVVYEQ